jgi:hypothetical protein
MLVFQTSLLRDFSENSNILVLISTTENFSRTYFNVCETSFLWRYDFICNCVTFVLDMPVMVGIFSSGYVSEDPQMVGCYSPDEFY